MPAPSGSVSIYVRWLFLLALTALPLAGWWYFREPAPDLTLVLHANLRGVGRMEQFQYGDAVEEFEQVVALAPSWLPGRINLGIALMNQGRAPNSPQVLRATETFQEVLRRDPNNRHATYCLGIIAWDKGDFEAALPFFEKMTQLDPHDAYSWLRFAEVSRTRGDDATARTAFQRAYDLDPYLNAAIHNLAQFLREHQPRQADAFIERAERLRQAEWGNQARIRYTEMGPYADVIGRDESTESMSTGPLPLFGPLDGLEVKLAPGTRWAKRADFGSGIVGRLRSRVRERFGGTMVVLDYNRDGRPDLFLIGAAFENGRIRDLLLRNDGAGKFTDVTEAVGLGGARATLGCCVADFDNNLFPDLLLTGIGRQYLFRNQNGRFEDVSALAGLDRIDAVCLGSTFVDLDQDGDLDLLLAQFALTPDDALARLEGEPAPGGGLAVFLNVGAAPPHKPADDPPPLQPRFQRSTSPALLPGERHPVVAIAASDLDGDRDLDLLVLADGVTPSLIMNDRLLSFRRAALPEELFESKIWNGALVLDANRDGRSDLLLVGPGQRPALLVSRPRAGESSVAAQIEDGLTNSPPLLQAHAVDLDYDGWTDVVGLSAQHLPVLLHNDGRRLVHVPEAFGAERSWPNDVVGLAVTDVDGDGNVDLCLWSESAGLQVRRNRGNTNRALLLQLTGHRHVEPEGNVVRSNADGFGTRVVAQTENHWTGGEYVTLSAGLGQSRQPFVLGLGKHGLADVVRLRWPDNCAQAELNVPAGQVRRIDEKNRKPDSCPILFSWNGERFAFVTDFLGEGSIGEAQPDGSRRKPRPEESIKIEAEQLAPRDGWYLFKFAEPMDEVTYLDHLECVVVDHPAEMHVYPDERFASAAPPPSQDLLAFRRTIAPVSARDQRGKDVLPRLLHRDRDTVRDFDHRTWAGYAEDHWIELDFGDRLTAFTPNDRLVLCLAGWTDYPYPDSIWAATQAGIALQPPVLERRDDQGRWQPILETGFPAGLPRMMTCDVTGKLGGERCVFRLRGNMTVYWDQIFVAVLEERLAAADVSGQAPKTFRVTRLDVHDAELVPRGCMLEYSPDGRQPTLFDYDRVVPVPTTQPTGYLTKFGDVTELLRGQDDRFVIFGPGDELSVRFDAHRLPKFPEGWKRSFILRTAGFCKDCAPFTVHGETVEPLPFRAMSNYPYGVNEHYPRDVVHSEYRRRYNTRFVGKPGR